ncbi:hypothetical protein PYW08_015636 [Mythimna loreyi]|uniref:Uncharacterized protein n=1 Tax=Mythimna loreyi TaxID=667449 RepID=A0ACC2QW47_9NEOP|nr:hypothetical protein PYW08_015636 [Mythimna loreyi]
MEQIIRVPSEIVKIIPIFSGEARQLPLFIKKCEYVLSNFQGSDAQNEYLFHVITSRLTGEAANLVGEREQINTWHELKTLISEHFGDPRTEECLVLELESLKIKFKESYLDFCHRIQNIRSILIAKVNETINDPTLRQAKQHIYNNSSLNVFLYNLPAYLVRLVRLRNVNTLEGALRTVLEEENFQTVYDLKNPSRKSPHNNSVRPNGQPRPLSGTHAPNKPTVSDNQLNSQTDSNHNSRNNSSQFRNNNFRHNSSNSVNHGPHETRSAQLRSQHIPSPPSPAHNAQFARTGANTDVTMRTASSRRVNYTNNDPYITYNNNEVDSEPQPSTSSESSSVQNFFIQASSIEKK